jgi:hypothetical protein
VVKSTHPVTRLVPLVLGLPLARLRGLDLRDEAGDPLFRAQATHLRGIRASLLRVELGQHGAHLMPRVRAAMDQRKNDMAIAIARAQAEIESLPILRERF